MTRGGYLGERARRIVRNDVDIDIHVRPEGDT